jgi:hypothetical protein
MLRSAVLLPQPNGPTGGALKKLQLAGSGRYSRADAEKQLHHFFTSSRFPCTYHGNR